MCIMHFIIILASLLGRYFVSSNILPMFIYEKGDTGRIPCIVKGESQAHFWKVGEMFNVSKQVASYIHGSPDVFANETYGKFTVQGDGTLLIYHIDYKDAGNYHCRVVTKSSEYYGSAAVYIKALRNESSFGIAECNKTLNCRLYPEVNSELTCVATFVASQLNLRWLNSSVELPSAVLKEANEDGSFNVTSIIAIDYHGSSILSCEAFGEAMETIYALAELEEEEEPAIDISASPWMPVSIVFILLFVVCVILLMAGLLKTMTEKPNQNRENEEGTPMLTDEKRKLEDELKTSKDDKEKMKEELKISKDDNKKMKEELKNLLKELAERKSRASSLACKDESQTFLRFRNDGREESEESKKRREEVMKKMKESYKLTRIFQPEEKSNVVFECLEDIVQSTVDGNMACIVAFGGPKSGKSFTMSNYNPASKRENHGIIPRVVSKLLDNKKRLNEKGIMINILATHLVTYKEDGNENFKFCEMDDNKAEKRITLEVKGLKVEMPLYQITEEKQAINLLQDTSQNGKKFNEAKTMDLFHLYVETMIEGHLVSKGSLSLATFCDFNAVKRFIKNDNASPVISLMAPLIANKSCRIAIIATMNMDVSKESQETLEFIETVKNASQVLKKK